MSEQKETIVKITQADLIAMLRDPASASTVLLKRVEEASGMRGPVTMLSDGGAQVTVKPKWDSEPGKPRVYFGPASFDMAVVEKFASELNEALAFWRTAMKTM